MNTPLVIGICGGSASGKTFLKDLLIANSPAGKVRAFTLDSYYLPRDWQKADENGYLNFDVPEAFNTQKMIYDFIDLTSGFSIEQPVYNYKLSPSDLTFNIVEPAPVIIAEGIFLFYFKELFDRLHYKIYTDAPFAQKRQRRITRDIQERGYEESEIHYRFDVHAESSFNNYVLPFKDKADFIIENEHQFNQVYSSLLHTIAEY